MNILRLAACAVPFLLPMSQVALADDNGACPMTYETYEYSVPHTDMEECPADLAGEGKFCRVAVMAEVATVFVFAEATDCIVASKAYEEDGFSLTFN